MRRALLAFAFSLGMTISALAGVACSVPNTFINNTIADANQVNANFSATIACLLNAAAAGANNDITSLNALNTPIPTSVGGSTIFVGGTSTGSANAQIVSTTVPTGFTLFRGNSVLFVAGFTNTGATQFNANSTGLTNVYRQTPLGPQALTGGEIVSGQLIWLVYDGTQFEMLSNGPQFGGYGNGTGINAAATTDLGTIPSHFAVINAGAGAITNFGNTASVTFPVYLVLFQTTTTITFNNTSCGTVGGCIFTPGNASIQAQAGDSMLAVYGGQGSNGGASAGNWQIFLYQRANGTAPVSSTPNCGFNQLSWGNGASSSTVTAGWGSAVLTTSGGVGLYSGAQAGLTLNITLGTVSPTAGGMDGHVPGANAFVYMYAISNGSAVNLIGSPSNLASGVVLPAGYTYICYMGAIKTNGSSNLYGTKGLGRYAQYVNGGANLTALPLVTNTPVGTGCSSSAATLVGVTIQGASGAGIWVPATAVSAKLVISSGYNGNGPAAVLVGPNASYAGGGSTNPPPIYLPTNNTAVEYEQVMETTQFFWCANNAGGAVSALGYTDSVNAN